jgi:hypothetical protein
LILGAAAVHRCDKCTVLNLALAAEGRLSLRNEFFRNLFSRAVTAAKSKAALAAGERVFQTAPLPKFLSPTVVQ